MTGGYRSGFQKKRHIFKSIFMAHNETLNIWTHLLMALFFIALICWFYYYVDNCKDFYLTTINEISQSGVMRDFKEKIISLELFTLELVNKVPSVTDINAKEAISKFIDKAKDFVDINDDLVGFWDGIKNRLSKINLHLHMDDLSKFHKTFLGLNDSLLGLFDKLDEEMVDFDKIEWVSKLAELLPIKAVHHKMAIWPIIIYFLSATFCLGASATYHWLYPKGATFYKILHRMDLAGITILIFGSCVPILYYTFYCNPGPFYFYLLLQFCSCFGTFFCSMCDWFHAESFRTYKGMIYAGCGLFAGALCFHCAIKANSVGFNSDAIPFATSFLYIATMGVMYLSGLVFYVFRFPERWWPNKFQFFNSHVIWHCFVNAAAASHMLGVIEMYIQRISVTCITNLPN